MRRWQKGSLIGLGVVIGVLLVIIFVLTQTDFGRTRIRTFGLGQLASRVHGIVSIGDVHGNLLSGVTIENVVITDSAGGPFLRADTVQLRYSLTSLFRKHINLHDVRLVRPVIVIDQPPGQKWNFERLFPGDSVKALTDTVRGFGDWIRIDDMTLEDGTVYVRRTWRPSRTLAGAALERQIARALSETNREHIVRVPGGFQALSEFRQVNAELPLVLFADPDSAARVVDIARMSMTAFPFRPPPAEVKNLTGRVRIGADTAWFERMHISLPGSELALNGTYGLKNNIVNGRVHADTVSFQDLRFVRPSLPAGGGHMDVAIARARGETRAVFTNMDARAEGAHVRGSADVQIGSQFRLGSSNLAFDGVDTRLIEKLLPGTNVPVSGVMNGEVKLAGGNGEFDVDGWTLFRDRAGVASRISADGMITDRPAGMYARNLDLRFDPVQVSLLRTLKPDLPIAGAITGRATLNGNLNERFDVDADVTHNDPRFGRSHILAVGDLDVSGEFTTRGLRLRFDPVQAALIRAFQPDVALTGTVTGRANIAGNLASGFDVDADLVHNSASTGRSHVIAKGEIALRGGFSSRRLHVQLDPLQMRVVKTFLPDFDLAGQISGRATLSGELARGFSVDADLVHTGGGTGRSRILAVGDVLTADGFRARNLRVRMDPLQVALLKQVAPTLPIDGTISGRTTVNGSPSSRLAFTDMDITHDGSTGISSLTGDTELTFANGLQYVDATVRAHPLSLATAGLFAPSAGLHGTATGTIIARGNRSNIDFTTDVVVADGGAIFARGNLALGTMRYDVTSTLRDFDPSAVSSRAPVAALTGRVTAVGTGTNPETMRARIDAALVDSRLSGAPEVDSTRFTTTIADGLATVDRGHIALASARAEITGSFGLVPYRNGTLRYTVEVDTLAQVVALAQGDSTIVYPRPLPQLRRVEQARVDSVRIARATEVERAATGSPPPPTLDVDSLRPIPRDTIAGSVRAEGTLTGNIKRFDAEGTATLRDVLYRGNAVQSGDVAYKVTNAPTQQLGINLNADLDGVVAGGFAFDSATVDVDNRGGWKEGTGTADIAVFQDNDRDYRLSSEFVLALDRREVRLNELVMRFDSTVWESTRPGAVSWAASGVELRTIDLRNQRGGHLYADGRVPQEGSGDLTLDIDSLQIGDITALLQDTANTRGLLSLDARIRGTASSPLISGTLALDSASRSGGALPALRSTFEYANRELVADAFVTSGDRQLLDADVRLPLNLAFTERTGPLLMDGLISVNATMDSLPLGALPSFTPALQDLHGVVTGNVAIRGTFEDPQVDGLVEVREGGARIVDAGIVLADAIGTFRLSNDRIEIDTLVALSGGDPISVSGNIDLTTLTKPSLDLGITATEAIVLDNELGRIRANVDIAVTGPIDAMRVVGIVAVQEGVINAPEQTRTRRATNLDDPTLISVLDTLRAPERFRRGPNPLLRNLVADVRVTVERDTWVRNSALNVEIYTPEEEDALSVHVDNAQQALTLTGTINADRGEYAIAGRPFDITAGSLTFLGSANIDPVLQLNAQYAVPRRGREALIIQINVGGYLTEPRLSLSSNAQPPLPESELISYLAFGRTSSSLLTQEGSGIVGGGLGLLAEQQIAGLGLGAFTDALVRGFENEGTDAGIDVFRLRPGSIPDELSTGGYFSNLLTGTELEVGEYLGKRLFVAAEAKANGQLPGLKLEFEKPNGFSWRATWEPQYLPSAPTFSETNAQLARVFSNFFFYTRRF